MRRYRAVFFVAYLLGWAGISGCRPKHTNTVRDVVVHAENAITTNDVHQLSTLVVRDDGAPCSEEELTELILRDGPAIKARLSRAIRSSSQVVTQYDYRLSDQRLVSLVHASARLSLFTVPQADACPRSVDGALQLLRAHILRIDRVDPGGTDKAPDYLSQRARERWNLDVETWKVGLSSPIELEVEEVGKNAIARLPTGRVVELSFEQGCWRIETLR